MSLCVVMPTFNEEENIENVVRSWHREISRVVIRERERERERETLSSETFELVVADFGSTDNTHAILVNLKTEFPNLTILENDNKNHGPKLLALYKYAIRNGAEWVFQTDTDGQTNPKEFEAFWTNRSACDACIGVRRDRGDGKSRAFVEGVVCTLLRYYFKVAVEDANAPYRLMKAKLLQKYIDEIPNDYNIPNIILTAFFVNNNENVIFKDISFAPRTLGKQHLNILGILKIGIFALRDFYMFKHSPLMR